MLDLICGWSDDLPVLALISLKLTSNPLSFGGMFRTDCYFEENTGHVNYCSCSFYSGYSELEASMRPGVRRAYSSGRCCCNPGAYRVSYAKQPRYRRNSRADDFFSYANQPSSPASTGKNVHHGSSPSEHDRIESRESSSPLKISEDVKRPRLLSVHKQLELPNCLSPLKEVEDTPPTQLEQFSAQNVSLSEKPERRNSQTSRELDPSFENLSPLKTVESENSCLPQQQCDPVESSESLPALNRIPYIGDEPSGDKERSLSEVQRESRLDFPPVDAKSSFNKEIITQVKNLSMKDQYNILKQKKNTIKMCCSIS